MPRLYVNNNREQAMNKQSMKVIPVFATAQDLNLFLNSTDLLTLRQRFRLRYRVGRLLNRQNVDQRSNTTFNIK